MTPRSAQTHPEDPENHRLGFRMYAHVREHYDLAPGGVIIGRGTHVRKYAPITHTELPQELAKLATGDDEELVAFTATYGGLGHRELAAYHGDLEGLWYTWPDGTKTISGDQTDWIRAHALTVKLILEITAALEGRDESRLRALLKRGLEQGDGWLHNFFPGTFAVLGKISPLEGPRSTNASIEEHARELRAWLINVNIELIHRVVLPANGESVWACSTTIEAVYWHLANMVSGGTVRRCKRPDCGALFIQRHKNQEYCAPTGRQKESPCAVLERQRKHWSARLGVAAPATVPTKTRNRRNP